MTSIDAQEIARDARRMIIEAKPSDLSIDAAVIAVSVERHRISSKAERVKEPYPTDTKKEVRTAIVTTIIITTLIFGAAVVFLIRTL